MTSINCASISFSRETSCKENILSALSNYFYLGGLQVEVLQDNKVSLRQGEVSGWEIAWKVAAYVLTFPITAILYVAYQTLLCCHQITLSTTVEEHHEDHGKRMQGDRIPISEKLHDEGSHNHGSHEEKIPCAALSCPSYNFSQECAQPMKKTKSKTNEME